MNVRWGNLGEKSRGVRGNDNHVGESNVRLVFCTVIAIDFCILDTIEMSHSCIHAIILIVKNNIITPVLGPSL